MELIESTFSHRDTASTLRQLLCNQARRRRLSALRRRASRTFYMRSDPAVWFLLVIGDRVKLNARGWSRQVITAVDAVGKATL